MPDYDPRWYELYSVLLKYKNSEEFDGLRGLCRTLGLEERDSAHLSKILGGRGVGRSTQRRLARAFGILPPARKYHRPVMTPEQIAVWQSLTPEEKNERLGL